jgi:hypothetical protein
MGEISGPLAIHIKVQLPSAQVGEWVKQPLKPHFSSRVFSHRKKLGK